MRGPPNGGTCVSPLDWRAEKMNPGSAQPCERKGTAATTRYGVSPSDEPNPRGRFEGFRQLLSRSWKRAATTDAPEWGARSSCPSNRSKQRRETKLNISSTKGLATRQGQLPQKPIPSDQILPTSSSQRWSNPPLPRSPSRRNLPRPKYIERSYAADPLNRNTILEFCNPGHFVAGSIRIKPREIQKYKPQLDTAKC